MSMRTVSSCAGSPCTWPIRSFCPLPGGRAAFSPTCGVWPGGGSAREQVAPLLDYTRGTAPSASALGGRDARSMNLFSGLLLYIDQMYGGVTLFDLLDYLPQNAARASGADFLTAVELWAKNSERFTTQL